jgi:hypothetical protein
MRTLLAALAALALLAPASAQAHVKPRVHARALAQRPALIHGIAGDARHVFVTEPLAHEVDVLDRHSGRQIATIPAPPAGFLLPFTLRVPQPGHLIVLDSGGFPPQGPPSVYDYAYADAHGRFTAKLTRTVSFTGQPLQFAEDVDVLPDGEYVVSESVIGALWLIGRDGSVRPGMFPSGNAPLPKLGGCGFPAGTFTVGGLPFAAPGNFAPGVGSLAVHGAYLYFSSTCAGGIQKLPIRTLLDTSRPAEDRVGDITTVTPRQNALESLKGITFDQDDPFDPYIYAGDPFRLQLIRVNTVDGRREVLSTDARLFNFTTATTFLPGGDLVTASDQEYRWSGLNSALTSDQFQPPWIVAEVNP